MDLAANHSPALALEGGAVENRQVHIRRAVVGDAERIAEVDVRSWQGAYRGLLPQAPLDALDPAQRVPGWTEIVEQSAWPQRGVLVVMDEGDGVVAFAELRPTRDADHDPGEVGEIVAFYVLPDCWRRGIGAQLMSTSVEALRVAGFAYATLWVLETNVRATTFYTAMGWRRDGASEDTISNLGRVPIRYVRYRRDWDVAAPRQGLTAYRR